MTPSSAITILRGLGEIRPDSRDDIADMILETTQDKNRLYGQILHLQNRITELEEIISGWYGQKEVTDD